ncbi:hypothetical protein ACFTWF_00310 [Rhodococcus sp. NPDC056960]|uniref:hypothetical protein n=1 Tax=Rhodococcus sp. NPDC056960 TaxID=3345982 RepID=UPI00363CD60C
MRVDAERVGAEDHEIGALAGSCCPRVQTLLDTGTVSSVAVAHPELLGLEAMAHVSVAVAGPVAPAAEVLCESESAVYISAVSGRYNIIAELRVPGQRDLYDAIAAIRGPAPASNSWRARSADST